MSTQDFTTEDMAEMRRQGDMRAFIRQQLRPMRQPEPTPSAVGDRPGHIVGAWPVACTTPETAGTVCSCPACVQLHHNPQPADFDPLS